MPCYTPHIRTHLTIRRGKRRLVFMIRQYPTGGAKWWAAWGNGRLAVRPQNAQTVKEAVERIESIVYVISDGTIDAKD